MGTVMYENCPDEPHYDGATDGSVDVHLWIFPVSLVSLKEEIELKRKERKTNQVYFYLCHCFFSIEIEHIRF